MGASEGGHVSEASRSRWLRHRFTAEERQAMIDLYRSGAPARVVAERYGIGVRAVKRLLQTHGIRRRQTA
ncbi:MAG: helix-turn-helix domain-containing protein [Pseudonocardiaceae bacterium]